MKIRNGFVSNSSSSSFTCEICSATESGWDASPNELGFARCEHGHIFCDEEKLSIPSDDVDKDLIRFFKKTYEDVVARYKKQTTLKDYEKEFLNIVVEGLKDIDKGDVPDADLLDYDCSITEIECPICNFCEPSYYDMVKYFSKTTDITRDEVFKEVKKINKRRRVLRDHEYVEYCLKKQKTTVDDLLVKWKKEFKNYSSLKDYLRKLK